MKKFIAVYLLIWCVAMIGASCGSSRNAEAERKRQEQKQKAEQLDQDKRRFENQNNKDLK